MRDISDKFYDCCSLNGLDSSSDCCILICRFMQNTTTQWRRVTQFLEKYTSHFIWKVWCVRGSWRPNKTAIYWPPHLWPSASLSRSPGLLNRRAGDPLCKLTKMEDFKNCMLEFLKQQEMLRQQEMERIENQRQENSERHRRELKQQKKVLKITGSFLKNRNLSWQL